MWPFTSKAAQQAPKSFIETAPATYPETPHLSALFEAFATAPDLQIVSGGDYVVVRCFWGEMSLMDTGKPKSGSDHHYWAAYGKYRSVSGVKFDWERQMPGRRAMSLMWDALARVATLTGMGQQTVGPAQREAAPAPVVTPAPVVNVTVPKRALDDLTRRELYALTAMHAALSSVKDRTDWPQPAISAPAFFEWADALMLASKRAA